MRIQLAASLLLLPLSALAAAAQTGPTPPANDASRIAACLRQSPSESAACIGAIAVPCVRGTTGDRRDVEIACARREQAVWRERVGLASRTLLSGLDSTARTRFTTLQLAWEGYTAQKCAFLGSTQPAARAAGMQAGCELRETAQRSLEIERLASRRSQRPAGGPPVITR